MDMDTPWISLLEQAPHSAAMLPLKGLQQEQQAERGYDQNLLLRLTHQSCHGSAMTKGWREAGARLLSQAGEALTMSVAPPTLPPQNCLLSQPPPPPTSTAPPQAQQEDLQYQELLQRYWHARTVLRQHHLPGLEPQSPPAAAGGGAASPGSPCGPLEQHVQPSSNPGSQLCTEGESQPQQPTRCTGSQPSCVVQQLSAATSHPGAPSSPPASTAPHTLPLKRGCPGSEADPPPAQQMPASGLMPPSPPMPRWSHTHPGRAARPAVPGVPASCSSPQAGENRLGQQAKRARGEEARAKKREHARNARAKKKAYIAALEQENLALSQEVLRLQHTLRVWATQDYVTADQALDFISSILR